MNDDREHDRYERRIRELIYALAGGQGLARLHAIRAYAATGGEPQ